MNTFQGSVKISQEKESINIKKDKDNFQTIQNSRLVSKFKKYRLILLK